MIRIVTRAHLAALEAGIESAQASILEVQAAADDAASCHTRSAQRLSTALASSRAVAEEHQADAAIVRELLDHREAQLAEVRATVSEQAEQIKSLRADLDAAAGAVVLLSYGQLVSVHPDAAVAKQHAVSLGASTSWRPVSDAPASEVRWRTARLSDFVVRDEAPEAGAR
ncbi:hypothetical protein [Streptomyces benahoarensis]|uniref:Uncharacterized protein n=1 Tax=Streptomyces benahoarensis TaxID=2595054 RepID=A0A553ZPG6_9ACTN|nr:hypothetical protein [Streptomyces benahoarensis]TSB28281.1 hypothetical protein FNJ62_10200 [Streptomyces benahoarensis]TSB43323.1 hypothetical protein FNZ23_05205 [Streptomyces benahoarensis]